MCRVIGYTDPTITAGSMIKVARIIELRDGTYTGEGVEDFGDGRGGVARTSDVGRLVQNAAQNTAEVA